MYMKNTIISAKLDTSKLNLIWQNWFMVLTISNNIQYPDITPNVFSSHNNIYVKKLKKSSKNTISIFIEKHVISENKIGILLILNWFD